MYNKLFHDTIMIFFIEYENPQRNISGQIFVAVLVLFKDQDLVLTIINVNITYLNKTLLPFTYQSHYNPNFIGAQLLLPMLGALDEISIFISLPMTGSYSITSALLTKI